MPTGMMQPAENMTPGLEMLLRTKRGTFKSFILIRNLLVTNEKSLVTRCITYSLPFKNLLVITENLLVIIQKLIRYH